jgi:hypothetical protein
VAPVHFKASGSLNDAAALIAARRKADKSAKLQLRQFPRWVLNANVAVPLVALLSEVVFARVPLCVFLLSKLSHASDVAPINVIAVERAIP